MEKPKKGLSPYPEPEFRGIANEEKRYEAYLSRY
jgi:hypothetical protein